MYSGERTLEMPFERALVMPFVERALEDALAEFFGGI
jgi:hypothetical protein